MNQNIKDENNLTNLYELCSGFFKYEELLKNKSNEKYEGFFMEKEVIEELKRNIFYEQLKPYSNPKIYPFNMFIKNTNIKKYLDKEKVNEIKINIINVKFKNGEELIKTLNDNKKYYLIDRPLWNKICKKQNKYNIYMYDKGIKFSLEKNNIILYFNKNEKLYFKINNGIIEKSSFIENKSIYKKSVEFEENLEEDEIRIYYNNIVLPNQNFKFKKEIEILIRLYYYQKDLKEKNNTSSYLLDSNKETVYLINKLWIEKF